MKNMPWIQVAIIVPYQDRESHLKVLQKLAFFLQKQPLDYAIIVMEQVEKRPSTGRVIIALAIDQMETLTGFSKWGQHYNL